MSEEISSVLRLIGALESLLQTQRELLEQNDFEPLPSLQDRAQRVLLEIAHQLKSPTLRAALPPSALERGRRLAREQGELLEQLAGRLSHTRLELQTLAYVQSRLNRFREAYGWPRFAPAAKSALLA